MNALLQATPPLTQTSGPPLIQATGISKAFGALQVLRDIDLTLHQGEILTLLGPSGCGKSTLLNILSGLLNADSGSLTIQGDDAAHFQHWRRIGYLFQEDRLLPWRTVQQNVNFGLENLRLSHNERRQRVMDALHLVGLADFTRYWPYQLSGGMRSRVALARSLVTEPEILLMDEPFSKLDPQTRSAMHDEVLRIQRLTGMSIVMVTHDVEEAVVLADRVVIFKPHPGHIHHIQPIDLPRPRLPTSQVVSEQIRLLRLEV
ncbi:MULTISPECIES: ABC transporter ATP-binding protein [unclassified Brenneria]|uniref:ABC transporter ATP-binding protein n=1 Tax=unclassified Brenneria TaxID=2634434 RepID=UPI00155630E4|nr:MULTISPECIES: ABC transporter ATP-binding protein [unclassified Brenneria]MBJ7221231.1 ABC transporter ATP-binding protein [Brenneria sp. L3-3C-1]MEE3642474.1 ABC transporter ATP-binding protein [Brenneria sp. L3_3C_1]MEE3650162.1 ABC transporter ATP-binding protein [Brenneria sp. HEZEL_4_2_4]NPD00120.1 ABC transporter ATP-binding protein [Brenneria sp. hezel4-2-4]